MIRLAPDHLKSIEAAAVAAYPSESCGLLAGRTETSGDVTVTRVVASRNMMADDRTDRFEVDPQVRFDLMRELEGSGEAIVGHYHSHPDHPAEPSEHDMAVAWEPDLIWLITTVPEGVAGDTRAFRLNREANSVERLSLDVTEESP